MKAVILAGGFGTRISEETGVRPKPMVEIGDRPILWHIMKMYGAYGVNDFIVCTGYKGYVIKEYFANYALHASDVTFDLASSATTVHARSSEPWRVTVIDTGQETMTGGRIKRVRDYLDGETFCCTYGDGVANIDLSRLVAFHREQGGLATLTAVQPPGRFGAVALRHDETKILHFREKPEGDGGWINGGFFVLEPEVLDYIAGDATSLELEPFRRLSGEGMLNAYKHTGYWQSMDTLRDKHVLEEEWASERAPWVVW